MSKRFTDYDDARRYAGKTAREIGIDVGIRRTEEFGRDGYTVNLLPKPAHRAGSELRCEVVTPMDPLWS